MNSESIPGLSKTEAKAYLAILQIKNASIKDIAKHTGIHRTNIYDIMERLREKGIISKFREGRTSRFRVADPENLFNYLDQQKESLKNIMPSLKQYYKKGKSKIDIEVLKGREGIISSYRDIIRAKTKIQSFGISMRLKEKLPIFREQFVQAIDKNKIPFYLIYTRKPYKLPKSFKVKYLEKEFISPVEVHLYGNKTLQIIWEPEMRAILITSKELTETYRKHFDLLWGIANPVK